jgi:hypothetical protein
MKRILILATVGLASFMIGTAGVYLAMPSVAPDVVEQSRVRLDSLGLIQIGGPVEVDSRRSLRRTSTSAPEGSPLGESPMEAMLPPSDVDEIVRPLEDSLSRMHDVLRGLERDKNALLTEISHLEQRLATRDSQQIEVTELSRSLNRLEDDQLGRILAQLDVNVIELLYIQASARDRTRMLQNMAPDRAARFVRSLLGSPMPANDEATNDQE